MNSQTNRNAGRGYWRQTGVVPRWQLFLVYLLIVGLGITGFLSIRDSRKDAIERTCREQNARHDNTLIKLDEVIANLPPGRRKRTAIQNKGNTVLLIDALVPKIKDCSKRADNLVR